MNCFVRFISHPTNNYSLTLSDGRCPTAPYLLAAWASELSTHLQVPGSGALVVPAGVLTARRPEIALGPLADPEARAAVERLAMEAVMEAERRLGREPRDVSAAKLSYEIESRAPNDGRLLFIEVEGRKEGSDTVTITKNEILAALIMPDDFVPALVEVDGDAHQLRYIWKPLPREPDFEVTSVNYDLKELLARAGKPS